MVTNTFVRELNVVNYLTNSLLRGVPSSLLDCHLVIPETRRAFEELTQYQGLCLTYPKTFFAELGYCVGSDSFLLKCPHHAILAPFLLKKLTIDKFLVEIQA
jgi:hypothetical protein